MTSSYLHLALAQLKPGMILSDEVLDPQGHVLLPKGAVLSEATIASLGRHHVDSLAVMAEPDPVHDAAVLNARTARLAHLFRRHDPDDQNDWATGILRHYMEDFRLEREVAP